MAEELPARNALPTAATRCAGPEPAKPSAADTRRDFLRGSSMLLAGAMPARLPLDGKTGEELGRQHESPSNSGIHSELELKIGVIGCGRRGMSLASQLINDFPKANLVALADAFGDRLQQAARGLRGKFSDSVSLADSHRFVGLDSYQRLLESDLDLVVLAGPPSSRPQHAAAAVAAGKHVVAARAIATDIAGVHQFAAAEQAAGRAGTWFQVAFDHRRSPIILETVGRLQAGQIGRIVHVRVMSHSLPPNRSVSAASSSGRSPRKASEDGILAQLRQWTQHTWLSGGGLLERHVDGLDLTNWILGQMPQEAQGMAEWLSPGATPSLLDSDRWLHAAIDYRYPSGVHVQSHWRESTRAWRGPSVTAVGTDGWCDVENGRIYDAQNELQWQFDTAADQPQSCSKPQDGWQSTLTALLGREACLTGRAVSKQELYAAQ